MTRIELDSKHDDTMVLFDKKIKKINNILISEMKSIFKVWPVS